MNHEAIIVGGGISGCAAAYYLAKAGVKPTLFERHRVASHASGFAFGMVSAKFKAGASSSATERMLAFSVDLHHSLAEDLADESGTRYSTRHKAGMYLAFSDAEVAQLKPLGATAFRSNSWDPARQDIRWLVYGELSHIEARVSPDVIGALYVGRQLEVQPAQLTNALWEASKRMSGAQMINSDVLAVNLEGGKVAGVVTSDGLHSSDVVILAAGPWSGELLKRGSSTSHLDLPVHPLKGEIVRFDIGDEPPMPVSLWWGGDYAASKPDGLLYAGTTEEHAGFDEETTDRGRNAIVNSVQRVLPFLEKASVVRQTACLRPSTTDGLPVVGEMPDAEGLVVATGGGRSGIELGPGIGKLAAGIAVRSSDLGFYDFAEIGPARFAC